jgi:hypothetical protein
MKLNYKQNINPSNLIFEISKNTNLNLPFYKNNLKNNFHQSIPFEKQLYLGNYIFIK